MMSRLWSATLFSAVIIAAAPASAQNVKAGLWAISTTMKSSDGLMEQSMAAMQQHMANLSPEQRKTIEDMMAKNGVEMPATGAGGAIVVKMCVSKEMAAQNHIPVQQGGGCTHKQSPGVGKTIKVSFSCTQPPISGEGRVTFIDENSYAANMTVATKTAGAPHTTSTESTARWLGADCGNIKPSELPKAK